MGEKVEDEKGFDSGATDPLILHARRKAEALGLDGNIGEILCASSEEEMDERMHRLGAMGGPRQLVTYALPRIYKANEHTKAAAQTALAPIIAGWGLPDNFIEWYLTFGEGAPERFDFDYGDGSPSPIKIDRPRQKIFRDAARAFSFTAVRDYLLS